MKLHVAHLLTCDGGCAVLRACRMGAHCQWRQSDGYSTPSYTILPSRPSHILSKPQKWVIHYSLINRLAHKKHMRDSTQLGTTVLSMSLYSLYLWLMVINKCSCCFCWIFKNTVTSLVSNASGKATEQRIFPFLQAGSHAWLSVDHGRTWPAMFRSWILSSMNPAAR